MKKSHIYESTEKRPGMIYINTVHNSSRTQGLENDTVGANQKNVWSLMTV